MFSAQSAPLADRMRPRCLDEFVGQTHLLAQGKALRQIILNGKPRSMLLWGPPGTGKTTLARLVAHHAQAELIALSAVLSGIKEIREAVAQAVTNRAEKQRDTILFVDEVHRFNKAQQDAFLPHVENGTISFIGATTENPSFEVNNALLSRARVYVLKALTDDDLLAVLEQALTDPVRGLARDGSVTMDTTLLRTLAAAADGDARRALNFLELAVDLAEAREGTLNITEAVVRDVLSGGSTRRFDKQGEAFYDQISALHKSVRGSAPDAALYWLCRMLDGGCDPLYLARRLVRIASEDIGNADPRALELCLNAWDTQERLGSPEGELTLAQAVLYLACAPKSSAVYVAYKAASSDAQTSGSLDVPLHLRNAPTRMMREMDFGKGYRYAHDEEDAYAAGEDYFPTELPPRVYYEPVPRGLEIKIAEKLRELRAKDAQAPTPRRRGG